MVGAVRAIGLLAVIIIDDCFGMVGDDSAIPVLSAYIMQSYNTVETMISQFVQDITHLQEYFPNLFYTVGEISKSSCELS